MHADSMINIYYFLLDIRFKMNVRDMWLFNYSSKIMEVKKLIWISRKPMQIMQIMTLENRLYNAKQGTREHQSGSLHWHEGNPTSHTAAGRQLRVAGVASDAGHVASHAEGVQLLLPVLPLPTTYHIFYNNYNNDDIHYHTYNYHNHDNHNLWMWQYSYMYNNIYIHYNNYNYNHYNYLKANSRNRSNCHERNRQEACLYSKSNSQR